MQEKTDGVVVRDYVVGSPGTIGKVIIPAGQADAGTYLPVWNGHGDLASLWRLNADGTLTLANSVSYGTWGTPTLATHNGIGDLAFRYRYVGAADVQWDDTYAAGLLYMHARHYSPLTGRFLQPDPPALEANLYAYAENSPVTTVDPSGMLGVNPNRADRDYCRSVGNWRTCLQVLGFRDRAIRETERMFGTVRDGFPSNAFLHCVWAGLCSMALGSTTATTVTNNHENYVGNRFLDRPERRPGQAWTNWLTTSRHRRMDLHNNTVGIRLGASIPRGAYWGFGYHGYGTWYEATRLVSGKCLNALTKGQLRWISGSLARP